MKSYNGLWDKMMSRDNIVESIENAHRGKGKKLKKKKYKLLVYIYEHRYDNAVYITVQRWINNYNNWYRPPIHIKDGSSGKDREIYPPTVIELVVQHCIVNVLKDVLLPMIPRHTYGSVPGRGSQDAVKYMIDFIRKNPKKCKYCCKMDHQKYFKSIPQMDLMHKLKRKIRDKKFYDLLCLIIMFIPGLYGLPIGFYTSQLLGVWYLYDSDEFVNNKLKPEGKVTLFVRWMDDIYFFGSDKQLLNQAMYEYIVFTKIVQHLIIKHNYQLFRFTYIDDFGKEKGRFLDAMGYRFYHNRVILRKSIMLSITRCVSRIAKRNHPSVRQCRSFMSYKGYLKVTNTYKLFTKYIQNKINYKECCNIISASDRRLNEVANC